MHLLVNITLRLCVTQPSMFVFSVDFLTIALIISTHSSRATQRKVFPLESSSSLNLTQEFSLTYSNFLHGIAPCSLSTRFKAISMQFVFDCKKIQSTHRMSFLQSFYHPIELMSNRARTFES